MINFELVSPEEKLIEEPVHLAVIPAAEGDMGVGAGHASYVVKLQTGVVQLFSEDKKAEPRKIFITGGFADVTGESCSVLAEDALDLGELDLAKLQKEYVNSAETLTVVESEEEKNEVLLRRSHLRLQLTAMTGKLVL